MTRRLLPGTFRMTRVRGHPHPRERAFLESGDALVREPERASDGAKRLIVGAAVEYLALALGQCEQERANLLRGDALDDVFIRVGAERVVDEVDGVGMLRRLTAAQYVGDPLLRPTQSVGKPPGGRLAAVSLPELLLRGLRFMQVPEGVPGKPEGPTLLGDGLLERLSDPRVGPGQEWRPARRIVPLDRAHDSERDLLLEVVLADAASGVAARQTPQPWIGELDARRACTAIAGCGGDRGCLDTRVVLHTPKHDDKRTARGRQPAHRGY